MKRLSRRVAGDAPGRDLRRGQRGSRRRPLPRRDVHFALENNGWNCTFECEVRVSASGSARRGRSPARGAPPGDPRRRKLSRSVAKAPIAPECTERIVDIPRFCSTPIPPRDAFATDLDTPPSRSVPGAPPVSSQARPPPSPRRSWPMDYRSRRERRNISSSSHGPFSPGAVPRGRGVSSGQGRRRDRRVTREIVRWVPRSPLNPRARLLEIRARGLSDVLADRATSDRGVSRRRNCTSLSRGRL